MLNIVGRVDFCWSLGLSSPVSLHSTFGTVKKLLLIRKPGVKITTDFEIKLK